MSDTRSDRRDATPDTTAPETTAPETSAPETSGDEPTPEPQGIPERLERPGVPELDAILGRAFPVLDDGFVRVVDYMGGDASIV